MNPSEDPNDRLLDSLLREQARGKADDELLQAIDARLDAGKALAHRRKRGPRAVLWSTAAAAAVMVSAGVMTWQHGRTKEAPLAALEKSAAPRVNMRDPAVDAQVRLSRDAGAQDDHILRESPAQLQLPAAPAASPMDHGLPPADIASVDGEWLGQGGGVGGGRGTGIGHGSGLAMGPGKARSMNGSPTSFGRLQPQEERLLERRPQQVPDAGLSEENYGRLVDQPWKSPWQEALSTFSIDVDTASYMNVRRMIQAGGSVPADSVRIEELVNYFDYRYEGPKNDSPFAVHGMLATCPWKPQHLLARVAIKGREIEAKARPASNLVFLIDVSGSMQDPAKLPLLKRSMRVLLDQLDERDRLGIVVYAGSEGVVLDPTRLDEQGLSTAIRSIEKLEAGGSTNGGAGIKRAYEMAARNLVPGGVNRVILATDGDFNVGTTGQGDLVTLVKEGAAKGVSLSVVGFGTGNFNDAMLEAITNEGNGNYFYIDGDGEAERVFLQKLTGTLVTIAKDVKIQVEFNPAKVKAYRLIGYANRILRHEDFNNDKVDAGDIGAGHTVTAFYEIVPPGVDMPNTGNVDGLRYQKPVEKETVASDDWLTLKLRYKHPEGDVSQLIESPLTGEPQAWEQAGHDFRFASAVALFGMKLRQMPELADMPWQKVVEIARPALADDAKEQRSEFISMVARHGRFPLPPLPVVEEQADALEGVSYLRDESTMWYVQFGLQSGGKWAPRFVGVASDKSTKLQNRVGADAMLSPGDEFFKDGAFAGRFKFLGVEEREVTSERTGLTQRVMFARYEDLKPNKKGARYESQAGLPDVELEAKAYYDRSAVLKSGGQEILVEEDTKFTLPGDTSGKEYFLQGVTPEKIVIQTKSPSGETTTREIRKASGE
ncbi:VWA domain-containing protein [Luteolibacter flavescens]|uniref:VWA domain-containing protein n=1 Tax=Luteolibacter flavescens TaxID=1859460 RepID=A0ABT3FM38_9BACT|nr:Amuc_1099 family pilus-like system protein [Luteolibacter flavescens]MCW1884640.1 VWA domain-containing protein [Luteolibacter flavescens]